MAYIDWTDELNTGIRVIDGQHRRIVTYINQLHEANESPDNESITDIIAALVDYTISHFAFEESLLEDAGYKVLAEHILAHNNFRNKIHAFEKSAKNGENITLPLLELLHNWLFGHILIEDGQYVPVVSEYLDKLEANKRSNGLKKWVKHFFN